MPKFRLTYTVAKKYEVVIEANNENDAVDAFTASYYDPESNMVGRQLHECQMELDDVDVLDK